MDKTNNISTLTTIGIDRQTGKLIDKLCKRYSLKKGEIVRLAFVYIDKACINPSEAPESGKQLTALYQIHQRDYKKLLQLLQLYSELSTCGVMDGKRKENLKAEIVNLINT